MPFVETYSVDFSNGNLHPSVNPLGWPDMVFSQSGLPDDLSEHIGDQFGITLRMTREHGGSPAGNLVQVIPTVNLLPVHMRLFMRVTFDLPRAHGFQNSVPEPWAVGLLVSGLDTVPNDNTAVVTCQFHRRFNASGVRLNTPGALQTDRPFYLVTPLDYSVYEHPPALFTLEHSFCGAAIETTGHTPGGGSLKIHRLTEVRDHRVYSSTALAMSPLPTNIQWLGAALASVGGAGQISVRLRRFSIWLPAEGGPL
jgi:hypothetical protein